MPRLVFLAALLGVSSVGLTGDVAAAAPKLDALKVEDAPLSAPAAPSASRAPNGGICAFRRDCLLRSRGYPATLPDAGS